MKWPVNLMLSLLISSTTQASIITLEASGVVSNGSDSSDLLGLRLSNQRGSSIAGAEVRATWRFNLENLPSQLSLDPNRSSYDASDNWMDASLSFSRSGQTSPLVTESWARVDAESTHRGKLEWNSVSAGNEKSLSIFSLDQWFPLGSSLPTISSALTLFGSPTGIQEFLDSDRATQELSLGILNRGAFNIGTENQLLGASGSYVVNALTISREESVAVPEPHQLPLLASGLAALLLMTRRRVAASPTSH